MKKGIDFELHLSQKLHQRGTPLALSSLLLRSKRCGQVDVARIGPNGAVELYEVKCREFLSPAQRARLQKSARFCSMIFNCTARVYFVGGSAGNLPNSAKLITLF